jgi:hypothetical protein
MRWWFRSGELVTCARIVAEWMRISWEDVTRGWVWVWADEEDEDEDEEGRERIVVR